MKRDVLLTREGYPSYGYMTFPNRKKPQIVRVDGNSAVSYGSFRDEEAAKAWIDGLEKFCGAKDDAE